MATGFALAGAGAPTVNVGCSVAEHTGPDARRIEGGPLGPDARSYDAPRDEFARTGPDAYVVDTGARDAGTDAADLDSGSVGLDADGGLPADAPTSDGTGGE